MKSLAQYRVDFLMMMFFTALSQICNLSMIGIIYSNIPEVGGWNMWEILILYGYLLFSEGCVNFFFQGAWKITHMLNNAEIDRFLIRPLPVGLQLMTARIDFDGLNKMVIAIAVFCLGLTHSGITWSFWMCFYIPGTLFCACIIRFSMIWIASCLSFWTGGIKNHMNYFVLSLGEFAKYPLIIYPPVLNIFFAYLLPYAFISYFPAAFLLGKTSGFLCVAGIPLVSIGMILLAGAVQKAGLKRYESSGN